MNYNSSFCVRIQESNYRYEKKCKENSEFCSSPVAFFSNDGVGRCGSCVAVIFVVCYHSVYL